MPQKEFIRLMEGNIFVAARLGDRLKTDNSLFAQYPRQQLTALLRLHIGGRALLKDIARRECIPTPNLCVIFRKLERDGLVLRTIDDADRRNTWYSVTPSGAKVAAKVLEEFRHRIAELFKGISAEDEDRLTVAMRTVSELLNKMENNDA